MEDCELSAIKLALEERWHWWRAVSTWSWSGRIIRTWPYLKAAKSLASHHYLQARIREHEAGRTVPIRPHQESLEKEKPILPSTSIVGSLTWEIERLTREAQQHELDPGSSPTDRLYVPTAVWGKVFHPGRNRTIQFFQRLFWWLSLVKDAQEYVVARSVCAQNKVANTAYPQEAVVTHCSGLCHRPATFFR